MALDIFLNNIQSFRLLTIVLTTSQFTSKYAQFIMWIMSDSYEKYPHNLINHFSYPVILFPEQNPILRPEINEHKKHDKLLKNRGKKSSTLSKWASVTNTDGWLSNHVREIHTFTTTQEQPTTLRALPSESILQSCTLPTTQLRFHFLHIQTKGWQLCHRTPAVTPIPCYLLYFKNSLLQCYSATIIISTQPVSLAFFNSQKQPWSWTMSSLFLQWRDK